MALPDLATYFRITKAIAARDFPGHKAITIIIEMPEGKPTVLRVPPSLTAVPEWMPDDARGSEFSEFEQAIIQVVGELENGESLSGEEVATRAGYPYNSRLRDTLARLGRAGAIASRKPGYGKP